MKIENSKNYKVCKFVHNGTDSDYGVLPGSDVKKMLANYTYDPDYDIWFSKACNIGYMVTEIE